MKISQGLVEQHIHGAFGIDLMNCSVDDVLVLSDKLFKNGTGSYFPTIMTDDLSVIKDRIEIIKEAKKRQKKDSAQIVGVHLEGPFINPEKSGIHDKKYIQPLNVDTFKQIEDDIIKIVTLAPELDTTAEFVNYLKSKNIKLSAGHTCCSDLAGMNQVTHLYNAMGSFHHREKSTVVEALGDDEIYTEIIADSLHVQDEVLKFTFVQKPLEKIILISDALPLAHSDLKEGKFAGQTIFNKNNMLVNASGVFAGSSMLLCDIVKNIVDKKLMTFDEAIKCSSSNQLKYHNIPNNIKVYWNDENKIEKTETT